MSFWADLPLRYKGLVVVSVPLVPLIVTAVLTVFSARHTVEMQDAVARTIEIRSEIDAALQALVDAETGARGYLLTQRDEFLEPFRQSRERLPRHIARLRSLVESDDVRRRIDAIDALGRKRIASLEAQIDHPTGEIPVQVLEAGRRLTLRLRRDLGALKDAEDRLLEVRRADARAALRLQLVVVVGGGGLGLIAGVLAAALFTRGIASRVERLGASADRLAQRQPLLPRLPGADELGRLAARVAEAAERLAAEERAREEADAALRRTTAEVQALNEALADRVRQQQALNQELESFSYSVSHDLRAPLRHIVGFVALLDEHARHVLDAEGRRLLDTIAGAARRLMTLIDDLLSFSRMARAELQARPLELDTIVRQAQQQAAAEGGTRAIEWDIAPLPRVQGDAEMLRLAFANLLSNAVKYTAPRDVARIAIGQQPSERDDEAVVFVRDNGVGFDMKYANRLFSVFQRLHSSAEFEGTGIGLANVHRIVARHGGRVWAEAAVHRGATFYVALPTREEHMPS